MKHALLSGTGLCSSLLVLAACSGPQVRQAMVPAQPVSTALPSGAYRLQPGDELEIRFLHTPELDVILPVRPDGMISLLLVHEMQAAGRTVEELRADLLQRYKAELADPELAVIVRTLGTYQVHVGGEVGNPGVLDLSGTHNVLGAVFASGGFLPTADPSEVLVVRRADSGYSIVAADLDRVLAGRDSVGNFNLRPYDIIYVPRTSITNVNQWVDQYIRKNIPISFSLTYRLNDE